jgi:predicted nucleic acid-binding protein
MDKILLDTDVILDFFFDRKPFSDDAAKILSWCEMKEIQGFVTPVIISNSYYLLRKTSTHIKVIEKLKELISIIDVIIMDREVVVNALDSGFTDFEDALQNFSAIKNKRIEMIITRNPKDYKNSVIGVFTPDNFIKNKISNF